jgi:hypothetical protein
MSTDLKANEFIPIKEVEAVGSLVTGRMEDDHYIIYLKSGRDLWVNYGRRSDELEKCRQSLIEKMSLIK